MVTEASLPFKLVVYDFDGVLTDNRVWVGQDGSEWVACNRSDGWWMKEMRGLGIPQVILSTEENPVVTVRGRKLGIEVIQGQKDKYKALVALADREKVSLDQICYVGNEMNDMACLEAVGFPCAPSDSHPRVLAAARFIIPCVGGAGIVRHLYDWMLKVGKP